MDRRIFFETESTSCTWIWATAEFKGIIWIKGKKSLELFIYSWYILMNKESN